VVRARISISISIRSRVRLEIKFGFELGLGLEFEFEFELRVKQQRQFDVVCRMKGCLFALPRTAAGLFCLLKHNVRCIFRENQL
jgi:hypothetical protein